MDGVFLTGWPAHHRTPWAVTPLREKLVCVLRVQRHKRLTGKVIALVASEDAAARESDQTPLVALGARFLRLRQMHDFLLVVGVKNEALTAGAAIAGKHRQHFHENQTLSPTFGALLVDHVYSPTALQKQGRSNLARPPILVFTKTVEE